MGKHSKPATLRPDEWAPHCVVTFPTSHQGLHAFRKLRELRKLHEWSWDKTNPEWIRLPIEKRIKKIMNQVAFTSADLAHVLRKQDEQADLMRKSLVEQEEQVLAYMARKWPEIDALAKASLAKDKRDGDNTKWLEYQIKRMNYQLGMKNNQNEKDQKRLKAARRSHEVRLKTILYAQRKAEQFKLAQDRLEAKAELAMQPGAEEKLTQLKEEVSVLEENLSNPGLKRTDMDAAADQLILRDHTKEISQLEKALHAKQQAKARDHLIARSIVPAQIAKKLPKPFTMDVEIKWADLLDAEYALGQWPDAIVHDVLSLRAKKESLQYYNAADYKYAVKYEVSNMLEAVQKQAREEAERQLAAEEELAKQQDKRIPKYLPALRNPPKRVEA
jgi:hypothetical protein